MNPVVSPASHSLWNTVSHAIETSSILEQGVLLFLLFLSVLSWAIIIMKWLLIRRLARNGEAFRAAFPRCERSADVLAAADTCGLPPEAVVFKAVDAAWREVQTAKPVAAEPGLQLRPGGEPHDRVLAAAQAALATEFARLQRGLDWLASISSSSPFIGLFGTVWGIMATFQTLGTAKSASLQVVAPGISAALIATAAGLMVAIPALMAYNWITARFDEARDRAEGFLAQLAVLVRTQPPTGAPAAPAA